MKKRHSSGIDLGEYLPVMADMPITGNLNAVLIFDKSVAKNLRKTTYTKVFA